MVGQLLNSLMPSRTPGSSSTLTPLNLTPIWLNTWTTAAEKPHGGNTGVPFMNRTTSLVSISPWIRSLVAVSNIVSSPRWSPSLRRRRLQGQGVQLGAHAALQRGINHLMLLNARFAAKRLAHDVARVVIAVAAQILNGYRRVGQAFLDQLFDLARIHRH